MKEPVIKEPVISRRRVVGVLMLAHAMGMMQRTSMSVAAATVSADFALSATAFGFAASMYFYAYIIAQIPMGHLVDTVGPRLTSSAALVFVTAGSLVSSLTDSLALLCLGRFIMGLGGASVFLSLMKIQSVWYRPDEFSTISGIMSLVSNIGSLMAQYPLAYALLFISWRTAFSSLGLACLLLACGIWLLVRDRPPLSSLPSPSPAAAASPETPAKQNLLPTLKRILKIPGIPRSIWAYCLLQGPQTSLLTVWGNSYIRESYGLDAASASMPVVLFAVGIMLGGVAAGYAVDWMGRRKPVIAAFTALHLASWGVLFMAGRLPMLWVYVLFALTGFSASVFIIYWTVVKELGPPDSAGLSISIVNMTGFLSATVCSLIIGIMLDAFAGRGAPFKYQAGFSVCFFMVLISLALLCTIPETGPGSKNHRKAYSESELET